MDNVNIDSIISKIEKLLRLSQSSNEHEAMSALKHAQLLQAKYNVSVEDVTAKTQEDKVVEEEFDSPDTKTLNGWFKQTCARLQDHYRVKSYIRITRCGRKQQDAHLVIVGLPFDVKVFKQTLFFAYNSMRTFSTAYVRSLPSYYSRTRKIRYKNDYIDGFLAGVDKALTESETENALIVRTPNAVVEHMAQKRLRKGNGSSHIGAGNHASYSAGFSDGKDAMRNRGTNRLTQ